MTTAMQVAQYMASKRRFYGKAHLQKLLYYAQAWNLAWDGVPIFDEPVEAWRMGPVVRSLHYVSPGPRGDAPLTDQEKANIDAVLDYYGRRTGSDLIELTHKEGPWKAAWGDRPADGTGSDPITHDSMRREYSAQSAKGQGPKRKLVGRQIAQTADLLRISSKAAGDWRQTLALLAQ